MTRRRFGRMHDDEVPAVSRGGGHQGSTTVVPSMQRALRLPFLRHATVYTSK